MLNIKSIMKNAYNKGIVIPAFNISYLPMVEPIASTLKNLKTFGLIEVSRPEVMKFEAKSFADVVEYYKKYADKNFVRLHLDHIPVIDEDGKKVLWRELIKNGIELGYDSVMIDGSRLSFEENINVTKEVVNMASEKNIPVEAELGAVLGHETVTILPYEELFSTGKGFTSIEEAEQFVSQTKVDWLSVAIGNIHGAITGIAKHQTKVKARLNIEHLKKIKKVTNIPIVLHGGSGVDRNYVLEGIKNGIAKVNVSTEVRQVYEVALKEKPGDIDNAQKKLSLKLEELIRKYYNIENSVYLITDLNRD
ncbi:MAG: class II fructose-bisphosphate aldolase [Candidatus Firestonebacteria bacterium]